MSEGNTIFQRECFHPDLFKIENVIGDNACFYRSIANTIRFFHNQNPNKIYNDEFNEQTQLAYELQTLILNWVVKNRDYTIQYHDDFKLKVYEAIELIHGIDYEEYIHLYSHFAGHSIQLPSRWGSFFEQSILSEIFKIPIIVMTLQKYDINKEKIINGRIWLGKKAYKNTRFKITQISGKQFLNKIDKDPICILWRKQNYNNSEHYMALYPKQPIKQKIIDKIS